MQTLLIPSLSYSLPHNHSHSNTGKRFEASLIGYETRFWFQSISPSLVKLRYKDSVQ